MFSPLTRSMKSQAYELARSTENDDQDVVEFEATRRRSHGRANILCMLVAALACTAIGYSCARIVDTLHLSHDEDYFVSTDITSSSQSQCQSVSSRREWRSLSRNEKKHYLDSVRCLKSIPSRLGTNLTLYDDFPMVHARIGVKSHGAAGFLSWHRYFVYVYEQALQNECGYTGNMPYWNWELDWEDIPSAAVFSNDFGFGGNGDPASGEAMNDGYCITDGPFANLEVSWTMGPIKPHCLSRGFVAPERSLELGQLLRPSVIGQLLENPEYEAFNIGLEDAGHLAIPAIIKGDFISFLAPYDPVFFLHHTQIDRLWSVWQTVDFPKRTSLYTGKKSAGSSKAASLDDFIDMGGLAPNVKVTQIIDTQGGLLCYRY